MTPGTSHEKAIAEIVGSLVLISIIVLAFAILAMVLLSQPAPQKIPAVAIRITNQSKIIRISHESGDSVSMSEVKVLVDDVPLPFTCNDCGDSWSIGETLTIDYSDHLNFPDKVDIVYSGPGSVERLLSSIYFGTMTPTRTPVTIPTSPTPVTTATTLPVGVPVANFTGTPTSGPVPLTVAFTDLSTGTPTGWRWTFGDTGAGNTSTLRNPSHTYTVPGNYSVNLTVSNTGGSNTLVRAGYITVSSTYSQRVVAGRSTSYTDTTGKVWSADRAYSVGSWGNTGGSTYSNSNTISGTPDPDLYRSERFGNFQYQFTVPDGNYQITLKFAEIYWDAVGQRVFNVDIEGTRVMSTVDLNALVGKNTAYDRTFAVTANDGVLNIDFRTITDNAKISAIEVVSGGQTQNPPVAGFTGTPTTGMRPLVVAFTDTSTNSPTSWLWNFGDGDTTNSTFRNPVHRYANAGTFTVTLTAANAGGSNATIWADYITVYPQPPVAGFTGTPTTGSNPLSVVFTDSSTNTPTSWLWDFGDGDTTNSTVKNPAHRYMSAGTYTVSLTATNAGGSGFTTRTGYIVVNNTMIQASRMYLNTVKTSDLVSGGYIQFTVRGSSSSIRHRGVTIYPKNNDVVRLTINSDTRGQIYASNDQILAFSFDDVGLSINSYNYGRAAINSIYIQNSVSSSSTLKLNVPSQSGWTDLRAGGSPIINGVSSAPIGVYNLWSIPTGITNLDNRVSTYYDGPVTGYSIT